VTCYGFIFKHYDFTTFWFITIGMSVLLDGKKVAKIIADRLQTAIKEKGLSLCLAIVQVGDRPESTAFINRKKKFGEQIGVEVRHMHYGESITTNELLEEINGLNQDAGVHGIIVQLPLPTHINKEKVINAIDPAKDADGLTAVNLRKLMENSKGVLPATSRGILSLLEYYKIPIEGKKVVVIGRSVLVGRSTAMLMVNKNATVTICHTHTPDLAKELELADIVVVAAGKKGLITSAHVHDKLTVIDVGINVSEDRTLIGDVLFDEVQEKVFAITPVPGGVGPMTVASLFENVFDAHVDILS
jgi:methylenetetrahydrofolate dehydrogenase (NADP+)/methenyltetrahydrofolate cyclohydrolase